jgi:hypothetical protein
MGDCRRGMRNPDPSWRIFSLRQNGNSESPITLCRFAQLRPQRREFAIEVGNLSGHRVRCLEQLARGDDQFG